MRKFVCIFIFLCFAAVPSFAQFTDIGQSFQVMSEGVPCWGDYDGDGDLDLHITGYNGASKYWKVYKNNSGTFTDTGTSVFPARYSYSSWCDWDNDGDLDGITTGWGSGIMTYLWRNNGSDSFSLAGSLAGVNSGSMAWGDYDNDGDEDLLLNGWYSNGGITISKVYRNDNGTFTDIGAGLQGVQYSASSWCDWDGDGDLDILYTGNTGSANFTGSYRNDSGVFTYVNLSLPALYLGSISWGDYDADGDPDLLLTGHTGTAGLTKIYYNNDGSFTASVASFPGLYAGNADWGDYDSDGDLDIVLTGTDGTSKYSLIYSNNYGVFTQTADVLPGISNGAARWGDYDYDGDLDLVVMGAGSAGNITKIYRNDYNIQNKPPMAPQNPILSIVDDNYLQFSFDAGYDDPDPVVSLTYSLQIDSLGDNPRIKTAHANNSGIRSIPAHGNLGHKLSWKYNKIYLPQETLSAQWKVQSVDLGFSGSEFAFSSSDVQFRDLELLCDNILNLNDSLYFENSMADSVTGYTLQVDDDLFFLSPFEQVITPSKKSTKGSYESIALDELSFNNSLVAETTYYWRIRPNYSNMSRLTGFSQDSGEFLFIIPFSDSGISLTNLDGAAEWGDFDSDGDLDIIISGNDDTYTPYTKLYRNDSGSFNEISNSIIAASNSSLAWGDYDNDNDLDLLITCPNGSKIYRNDSGSFNEISAYLPALSSGSAMWADYDNDGDSDIFICGYNGSARLSRIYRNDSGNFTDISAGITGVWLSSADWGDYDNDGDLDLVIIGDTGSIGVISKIYRNDFGIFTEISNPLPAASQGCVKWGDYDNDGDLDLLFCARPGINSVSDVFINGPDHSFTAMNAGLTGLWDSSADWGDYDNDGDLDIILKGIDDDSVRKTLIYRNDSGVFTDISAVISAGSKGVSKWGDFDNDGDLDILLNGRDASNSAYVKIYRNNSVLTNSPPSPPSDLNASVSGDDIVVSFTSGSDSETPALGLSYNIGIDINDENIKSEISDLISGYRKIVSKGNTGQNTSWMLKNHLSNILPQEEFDITLRAQSVDNCFAGSEFSALNTTFRGSNLALVNDPEMLSHDSLFWESSYSDSVVNYTIQVDDDFNFMSLFEQTVDKSKSAKEGYITKALDELSFYSSLTKDITYYWRIRPNYSNMNRISDFSQFPGRFKITPDFTEISTLLEGVVNSSVKFGDYDSDGDLDILLTGMDASNLSITKIYRNDSGSFTDISASLTGVNSGSAEWGDYDNDGDLDILLTGIDGSFVSVAKIYRNDAGSFTDIAASLEGIHWGTAVWGDYDNDGDLDILLTGADTAGVSKVYRNDKGNFTDINAPLDQVYSSSAAWGDYDNDGDLDILLAGYNSSNQRISKVYRNNSGTFSDINAALEGVFMGSVAWGDYDNDGDLDILLTGSASYGRISKIYQNNYGVFSDISAPFAGVYCSTSTWGDYDNDGDLDILLTGMNGAGERISKLYRNDAGDFTDISTSLFGVYCSSAAWGDYDNDGDLDILLTGEGNYNIKISKIYLNNSAYPNNAPLPPTGLNTSISGNDLLISFSAGSDSETPASGLSYNLGVDVNDKNIKSGMSIISNGYRKVVETGNIGNCLSWQLENCLDSVMPQERTDLTVRAQSVDHNFAGSTFLTANSSFYGNDLALVNNSELNLNDSLFWEAVYSDSITDYTLQVDVSVSFWTPFEQNVGKSKSGKAAYFSIALDELSFSDSLSKGITYFWRIKPNYSNPSIVSRFSITPSTFELMPEFSDINAAMPGLAFGSSFWGDYDNDGDLDVFVTGKGTDNLYYSIIYNNDDGVFNDINAGLVGKQYSYADWGDYDNDGDLDLALIGQMSGTSLIIYRNDFGSFTYINTGISCIGFGTVKWGDKDNDGDLDLLVTGQDASTNEISKIFENTNGTFSESNTGELFPLEWSCGDWADIDKDGDLDIVISGRRDLLYYSLVYTNENGSFIKTDEISTSVYRCAMDFGDYDNDGDPDLIITGLSQSEGYVTKIYFNENGSFSDSGIALTGGQDGSVNWGDYDNDGDLDILFTGYSPAIVTKIYINEGGTFTELAVDLKPSNRGRAGWGDYDNDGDLDILINGRDGTFDYFTKIYRNNIQYHNTIPSPPSNIQISTDFINTTVSFTPGLDAETPSAALSYNVELGLNDYSGMPSMSDSTGYRRIVRTGNIGQVNSWTITKGLPGEIIPQEILNFWCKIQSVDQAYSGSSFAQNNRLVPYRDLAVIPKNYMTGTDELVWEFVISDSVASYTVQVANDTVFLPTYEQTLILTKESKTGYVGVALKDLDFFGSLTDNTEYFWRIKPNHVNPLKQTAFNSEPNSFTFNPILVPPSNITISVSGQYVTLDWSGTKSVKAEPDFYTVYSSTNPYAEFPAGWTEEISTSNTSCILLSSVTKKFYCVTANNFAKRIDTGKNSVTR